MAKVIESRLVITGDPKGAEKAIDAIAAKLDRLNKAGKAGESVDRMARALERVKGQLEAIDRYASSRKGFDAAQQKLSHAKAEAERVAAAMAKINSPNHAAAAAEMRRVQAVVQQATRAYEIQKSAVLGNRRALTELGLDVSRAGTQQARLREELARTNALIDKQARGADHLGHQWNRHGAMGAAAGAAAGYVSAHGVFHGIKETVAAGANYAHEVTGLENAGRTPGEMREIEEASKRAARNVPTSTFTENLKVLNETTGAFGSVHHAIENLEFVQKAASVIHAAAGDKVQDNAGEMGNKMARFFEMRGTAGDSHLFQKEAAQMVRAMQFTRGNFNPTEMLNFAQQAKGALANYNMDFLGSIVPSLVTEMGGDRAGTAANAWRNVVMGKVRDKKQTEAWVKLGLLDPKLVSAGQGGSPQSWRAGAVKQTDLALSSPLDWTEQVLIPALQKKGVDVDNSLELSKALGTMFRNQNANQFAEQITQLRARNRLHKDRDLMAQVKPLDESYAANLKTDPTVALTAFTASVDNLMTVASSPAMKSAAAGINWIAEALQQAATWGQDHPAMAMTGGVAAGGGALAASGYLSYKLMTGFGLSTSAAALDSAAAALTAAAAQLGGAPGAAAAAKNVGGWAGLTAAVPYVALATAVAAGLYGMHEATAEDRGTTSGQRLRKYRGGSMADVYRRAFDDDRLAQGLPPIGAGVTGKVEGEVAIKVTVDEKGVRVTGDDSAKVSGSFTSSGPGSLGKSSPDAAAPAAGY